MDISRCLFPRERTRSSPSCSRRACPIYMECSRKVRRRLPPLELLLLAVFSLFHVIFSLFFFDHLLIRPKRRSFVWLSVRRKYFLCWPGPCRPTNLSSCRDTRANNFIPSGFRGMRAETRLSEMETGRSARTAAKRLAIYASTPSLRMPFQLRPVNVSSRFIVESFTTASIQVGITTACE